MSYSPTDTIFDFRVSDISEEQVQAWQAQAEFLLDEADAGAASFQATDAEQVTDEWRGDVAPGPSPARSPGGRTTDRGRATEKAEAADARRGRGGLDTTPAPNQTTASSREGGRYERLASEIQGLLDVEPDQVRVFPDAELPTIQRRSGLPPTVERPATSQTPEPAPRSDFVDDGAPSRYLHTASANPPKAVESLLTRPAPALGKAPSPPAPAVSLTAGQVQMLDEEIRDLHAEVTRVLATRRDVTGHALSLLREAREILLTEPHRLGRVEYDLNQVRAILERADEGRRRSSRRGMRVLLYLALWLAGTVAAGLSLYLYGAEMGAAIGRLFGSQSAIALHLQPFLWSMIAGSAGAVVGAILGFLAHIRSKQDFDRQHVVRFAIQPFMGVILGTLLYFFFFGLFASMGIDLAARSITRALPIVLALPAGLWQEWIYASLYRMMGFFTLRPRRR